MKSIEKEPTITYRFSFGLGMWLFVFSIVFLMAVGIQWTIDSLSEKGISFAFRVSVVFATLIGGLAFLTPPNRKQKKREIKAIEAKK